MGLETRKRLQRSVAALIREHERLHLFACFSITGRNNWIVAGP